MGCGFWGTSSWQEVYNYGKGHQNQSYNSYKYQLKPPYNEIIGDFPKKEYLQKWKARHILCRLYTHMGKRSISNKICSGMTDSKADSAYCKHLEFRSYRKRRKRRRTRLYKKEANSNNQEGYHLTQCLFSSLNLFLENARQASHLELHMCYHREEDGLFIKCSL